MSDRPYRAWIETLDTVLVAKRHLEAATARAGFPSYAAPLCLPLPGVSVDAAELELKRATYTSELAALAWLESLKEPGEADPFRTDR
jgi:hypothetical protein